MTPADYVNEIVLPAMKDFQAGRRSRRYAYQACMAVFHIKDHLHKAGETKIEDRIRQAAGSNHFDVVRSISNGAKHVETDATHKIEFRAGDDFDRPPGYPTTVLLGLSRFGDLQGGREIGRGPDKVDLYDACSQTLIAFCTEFPRHIGTCDLSGL
jgi:hypothetical protein